MKAAFCNIVGLPKAGDELRICYTATRGGRTEACYTPHKEDFWRPAKEGETYQLADAWVIQPDPDQPPEIRVKCDPEEVRKKIAAKLADAVGRIWGAGDLLGAKARDTMVVITSTHDDLTFYPMVNGRVEDAAGIIEVEQ